MLVVMEALLEVICSLYVGKGEKTGKDGDINRKSRVGSEREEEDHS